jgi:hypothetical protein
LGFALALMLALGLVLMLVLALALALGLVLALALALELMLGLVVPLFSRWPRHVMGRMPKRAYDHSRRRDVASFSVMDGNACGKCGTARSMCSAPRNKSVSKHKACASMSVVRSIVSCGARV